MSIDFRDSEPLYKQIIADIRRRISAGELKVGDRLASHRELSGQYGVSLITVKMALKELIRKEILFARAGKGTYVARYAPAADLRSHKTIGLVLEDLSVPLFADVLRTTERLLSEADYALLLSTSSGQMEKEDAQIVRFREIGADALIIASMDHSHRATDTVRELHAQDFPYVMISFVDDPEIHYVGVDHEQGAFLATDHLAKKGYDSIGYLGTVPDNRLSGLREAGYRRALAANDIEVDEDLIFQLLEGPGWKRMRSGYEIGIRLASSRQLARAYFVYNDIAAIGLEEALLEAGLRIPDDVALVGFDNIERASFAPVPLTTVRQPVADIGREAVRMLLDLVAGRPTNTRITLEPRLVVRASSGIGPDGEADAHSHPVERSFSD